MAGATDYAAPFVTDPAERSNVITTVDFAEEVDAAELAQTLRANGMTDGVHVRLMVTRGLKRTPYQDPRMTVGQTIAEPLTVHGLVPGRPAMCAMMTGALV